MLGERRRIDDRFGIFVRIQHDRLVVFRSILPEADQRSVFILDDIIAKVDECRDLLGSGVGRIHSHTAPQITLSKSVEIETCDNTQIIPSTFEGLE